MENQTKKDYIDAIQKDITSSCFEKCFSKKTGKVHPTCFEACYGKYLLTVREVYRSLKEHGYHRHSTYAYKAFPSEEEWFDVIYSSSITNAFSRDDFYVESEYLRHQRASEESCRAYRLLCVKCSVSESIKISHEYHHLVLIEDLLKKYERIKSDIAALGFLSGIAWESNPDILDQQMDILGKQTYYSLKDHKKILRQYEMLQRVLYGPKQSRSSRLKKQKNLSKPENKNDPSFNSVLKTIDLNQPLQTSTGTSQHVCRNLSGSKKAHHLKDSDPLDNEYQHEIGVNSQVLLTNSENAKSPYLRKAKQDIWGQNSYSKTPLSTKPNTESDASYSSYKKLAGAWVSESVTRTTPMSKPRDSPFQSTATKDSRYKNDTHKEHNLSGNNKVRDSENAVKSQEVNLPSDNAKSKKVIASGNVSLSSAVVKLSTSPLEQLRNAMLRLSSSCTVETEEKNKDNAGDFWFHSQRPSSREMISIYASDVYGEDQIEEEATCLMKSDSNHDLQNELRKQVTGFKEFSSYTQKVLPTKVKSKEMKEMWKSLSKKERDQWNSIAVRKRIDLRDQLEATDPNKTDFCNTLKKVKTSIL